MGMESMAATPVYVAGREDHDDGWDGNPFFWIVVLFLVIAFINGGIGGFGGAGAGVGSTGNFINNDFLYTNLKNAMDMGFNQVANQNFGLQKDLCQSTNSIQAAIAQNGYQAQMCCCETNRNIDAVRYEAAKNTCDITTAIHAEGEATRALITQNTMQELRDQLQAAQLQLGNVVQTNTLISTLRPFPTPAYITCSPYTAANGFGGYGNCGGGCGCGC